MGKKQSVPVSNVLPELNSKVYFKGNSVFVKFFDDSTAEIVLKREGYDAFGGDYMIKFTAHLAQLCDVAISEAVTNLKDYINAAGKKIVMPH